MPQYPSGRPSFIALLLKLKRMCLTCIHIKHNKQWNKFCKLIQTQDSLLSGAIHVILKNTSKMAEFGPDSGGRMKVHLLFNIVQFNVCYIISVCTNVELFIIKKFLISHYKYHDEMISWNFQDRLYPLELLDLLVSQSDRIKSHLCLN